MWTPGVVPSVVHATIGGYVTYALLRGARTALRRRLGAALACFTAYSVLIGLGYSVYGQPAAALPFKLCVVAGAAAALFVVDFARRFVFGERSDAFWTWALRLGHAAGPAVLVAGWAAFGVHDDRVDGVLDIWILVVFGAAVAIFAYGAARRVGGAGRLLVACGLPMAPALWSAAYAFGLVLPGYGLVRDLSLLAFCFLMLSAYMDHAKEPISLRHRLVASSLAGVLAAVATAHEVAFNSLRSYAADGARFDHTLAVSFSIVTIASSIAVLALFPLFLRRTIFRPVEALATGARKLQAGEDARVDVARSDELGTVGDAFNHMVDALAEHRRELEAKMVALERTNEEIAALNTELRRQVAARSRQLQEALGEQQGPHALVAGDVVDGRYRVLRELGGGGMGIVHEVVRVADGAHLALKVMGFASSRNDMVRFAREAEIAATVTHRNIVSVIDVGMHHGVPFLVMELALGGSLEDARARFGDVAWALPLLADVASGLGALHERGVVHRDLKPANVLLVEGAGRPLARVTDFGIARHDVDVLAATAQIGDGERTPLTKTAGFVGTLPYMAPESGKGGAHVTAKVDVFALGLIGYELLTGALPFQMPPVLDGLAGRRIPAPPPLPDSVHARVRALLEACVKQEPEQRPTAAAAARILGEG